MGGYKHPAIINGQQVLQVEPYTNANTKFYVYCDFVKPGKHIYTVHRHKECYLNKTIVMNRQEDIARFNKKQKFKKKQF